MRKQSLLVAVLVCLSSVACTTTRGTAPFAVADAAGVADEPLPLVQPTVPVRATKLVPSARLRVDLDDIELRSPRPRPRPDPLPADLVHPNRALPASAGS